MPFPKVVNIISCGRTGLTLLMGFLNSIDGYLIRGENLQIFHKLFEFRQIAGTLKPQPATINPYFNNYSLHNIEEGLRSLFFTFLDPFREHNVVGFKEVGRDPF